MKELGSKWGRRLEKKTIKPIIYKDSYSDGAIKAIEYQLFQLIYKPLLNIVDGVVKLKENARKDPLPQAFSTRRIFYKDGFVYGSFNASISRALTELGGKFNKTKQAFKISLSAFDMYIRSVISQSEAKEKSKKEDLQAKIKQLKDPKVTLVSSEAIQLATSKAIMDLERQFTKVTPESLKIPNEMNAQQKKEIHDEYIANMDLAIKGWADEAVERLRVRVDENVNEGFRADVMRDILMSEYGITKNKAKFIARQETSLLVSKYREKRYDAAGLTQYQWSTSQDERVRKDHKDLNNRIFRWDSPPIVDKATGRRANPGCDYGCRCVALPVINGKTI